jgi:hypothetical protein
LIVYDYFSKGVETMRVNLISSKAINRVVKQKSLPKPVFIAIYKKTGNKIELKISRELRWI